MNVTLGSLNVTLVGTTQHGAPPLDLGGTVLEDELRTFPATSFPGGGAITGTLQDRVVRMGDGTLAFYIRIKEFSGSRGITEITFDWSPAPPPPVINLDYRTDGLGSVGPRRVSYETSSLIRWTFDPLITPTALGRFMFMIVPGVTRYARPSNTPPVAGNRVGIRGGDFWGISPPIICFAPILS